MADTRRGQMSAWLLKKKSGTAMVRVRQYNKRFFTVDFDTRTFSYSHSESSKKASTEIPFSDIIDARLPDRPLEPTASDQSESKRLLPSSSLLKRATSFGSSSGAKEEESVVMVMTKPARTMELLCSSPAEAQQWFEAFQAAMVFDPGTVDGAQPARPPQAAAAVGGYPTAGPSAATLAACAAVFDGAAAAGEEGGAAGGRGGAAAPGARGGRLPVGSFGSEDEGSSDAATPTKAPMAKGTFLDLSVEPEAAAGAAAGGGGLVTIGEDTAAVVEATPNGLQARDFGLEEESSDTDSDASDQGGAAAVAVPSLSGLTGGNDGPITEASTAPGTTPGGFAGSRASDPQTAASSKYEDRQEGMTMQERLANLEFSDCEDEDDDPLGIGSKS